MKRIYPITTGLVVGFLVLVAGLVVARRLEAERLAHLREDVVGLATGHAIELQRQLDRSLAAANTLASVVEETGGSLDDFDGLARELVGTFGGITSVELARDNVITQFYPEEGRDAGLGPNLALGPERRMEIEEAIEQRAVTLAGPFLLARGEVGLVGLRPVFVEDAAGNESYWGLAIVVVTLDDFVAAAGLNALLSTDHQCELAALQHNGTAQQSFYRSTGSSLEEPVEVASAVPNVHWSLRVAPTQGWIPGASNGIERALIVVLSMLIAYVTYESVRRPERLRDKIARRTEELATANRMLQEEIVDRAVAEASLRESEARSHAILNTAADAIITVDRHGTIESLNPAAARIFGYTPAEAVGRHVSMLLPEERRRKFDRWALKLMRTRQGLEGRHKDGRRINLELAVSDLCVNDLTLFTGIVRDTTETRRAEAALREAQVRLRTVVNNTPTVVFALDNEGVSLIVDDGWPTGDVAHGDEDRLEQVLTNLLSNAVKFSHEGGVVKVRSERSGGFWRVEVQDNGIGIPEDEIPKLFQRFFRASNAAEAQIQGTGLGLYVCRAIVKGHGGEISLTSRAGEGTTVRVSVPLHGDAGVTELDRDATYGLGTHSRAELV